VVPHRHPQRNIVLTGFHAAGKSAIGHELSRRMRRPFIDLPTELRRRRARMRVLLPLSAMDEEEAQRSLVRDLSYRQETIIELPPDSAAQGEAYRELREFSFIVFLDPPLDVILHRMRSDRRYRDLLDAYGEDGLAAQLSAMRGDLEHCDFQLTGAHTPQHAAALIIHSFFT
jgi:shikimate kinase